MGDSSSQLLVAGQGDRGGLVGWWDTLAPPSAACVAEVRGRKAVVTALALLRPDAGGVLVFGDESGESIPGSPSPTVVVVRRCTTCIRLAGFGPLGRRWNGSRLSGSLLCRTAIRPGS